MRNSSGNETVHVLPLGDLKPHLEAGTYCHCQPRLQEQEEGATLVIHNAYDGREFYEFDDAASAENQ